MNRLRARQEALHRQAEEARERLRTQAGSLRLMTSITAQRDQEDAIKARWRGGPNILAFLFALPDCEVIRSLDARGDYFDHRTGSTWDLFFPGYYKSQKGRDFESATGSHPIGDRYTSDWYFSPVSFNGLRAHVEEASERRWQFSGGADLVLVNGWLPETGDPTVDWASTVSGQLTDRDVGVRTLTLAAVIERISQDLEQALEDPAYGVDPVVGAPMTTPDRTIARELLTNALGGIIAALATGEIPSP
jgi:hypothetical protein